MNNKGETNIVVVIIVLIVLLGTLLYFAESEKAKFIEESLIHGCAQYNSQTGDFEWINKEGE